MNWSVNWSALDFTGLANSLLLLVTSMIATVAVWIGRRSKPEPKPTAAMKIDGAAIVSSESVMMLAKEVAANTIALAQQHADEEKARQAIYRSIEAMNGVADQVEELRAAVQSATMEMIRRK